MRNIRKRMMDFEYSLGFLAAIPAFTILSTLVLCFAGQLVALKYVLFVSLVIAFISVAFKPYVRRDIMFAWI